MSIKDRGAEVERLVRAFEAEADKFPDIHLSTLLLSEQHPVPSGALKKPNHAIMLWQYYGTIATARDVQRMKSDVLSSDLQWALRGAQLSSFALIEGVGCPLFLRMAQRAGNLFDPSEAQAIKLRVVDEICAVERAKSPSAKVTAATNDNPLAIWLNYLLYYVSLTHPGRELRRTIEPDPFCLSLLALERLAADSIVTKSDRSTQPVQEMRFRVAMSFAGEHRLYVSGVVDALRPTVRPDGVFYDYDYRSQLARPNLDTLLQRIYRSQSDLVVVFLCNEYAKKSWCGLEWRAIRDIIKARADDRVMFVRFDDAPIDGVFSIDGYIDARSTTPQELAAMISERLAQIPES